MNYSFRLAVQADIAPIWEILQNAIQRRKADGSDQWQDGYPNLTVIQKDLNAGAAFVLMDGDVVIGYCAVYINDEPEYEKIVGSWLSNEDFVVFHRVAIAQHHLGKGLAKKIVESIEAHALRNNIFSVKADTNYDNVAMLKTFEKMGYTYCGKVFFRGSERRAFEKVLRNKNVSA